MAKDPPARSELDDETLRRCQAQDPLAFRAFVVRYQRPVFAVLSRLLGPGSHVDDLAQEVFLKAYRAFPRFDLGSRARPSTWLLTIATRAALDVRRSGAGGAGGVGHLTQGASDGPGAEAAAQAAAPAGTAPATPESEHERLRLGTAIARAAATLPEEQRVAFVLFELEGFSLAEIAHSLEIPENTVKTRLFRARERLRAELGGLWKELHG